MVLIESFWEVSKFFFLNSFSCSLGFSVFVLLFAFMGSFGRFLLVLDGSLGFYLVLGGYSWFFVALKDSLSFFLSFLCGSLWFLVVICGSSWFFTHIDAPCWFLFDF